MENMKLVIAFITLASCSACQKQMSIDPDFTQVTSDSIAGLIGKKLELNGNYISLSDDGTFSGTWKSAPIAGKWEMRDNFWCRTLTAFHDTARLRQEDCQLWEIDGAQVRGTRDKGNGASFVYTAI